MRIAQANMALTPDMPADDAALSGEDALMGQQMLAEQQRAYPELAPRAETARLAYLMLATFGR
jgi:hypothetical protein